MIRADEKNVEIIIPAPDSEFPVIVEKVGVDNKAYNNTNEYKGKNYWRIYNTSKWTATELFCRNSSGADLSFKGLCGL